jgi:hypothetical protein
MNQKFTYVVLGLYSAAYLLLFGTWAALVLTSNTQATEFVLYIKDALIGLTAHVMTLINFGGGNPPPPAVVTNPVTQ